MRKIILCNLVLQFVLWAPLAATAQDAAVTSTPALAGAAAAILLQDLSPLGTC